MASAGEEIAASHVDSANVRADRIQRQKQGQRQSQLSDKCHQPQLAFFARYFDGQLVNTWSALTKFREVSLPSTITSRPGATISGLRCPLHTTLLTGSACALTRS